MERRFLIFCASVTALACSKPSNVRGIVLFTQYGEVRPAQSVPVHALPARNDIDRELAALCESDSLLTAGGVLEAPIGPVRVHVEGVELNASPRTTGADERSKSEAVAKPAPWVMRDAYTAFRARMDSLLRRAAIANATTDETGNYQLVLQNQDSIELFAFSVIDDAGTTVVWRDRVVGVGTHDLRNPMRRMHRLYCGEP